MNTDFNAKAAGWDEDPRKRERAVAVAKRIRDQIPLAPSMEVLEFGSGTGLLGFELLDEVASVCFADPAEEMLNQVKRKLVGSERGKGSTLLVEPGLHRFPQNYDLIISLMTLHHVEEVSATLDLLVRHLSPGGYLALCDLDLEDGSFHDFEGDVHPGFDRSALIHLLALRGLSDFVATTPYEIVEEKEAGPRRYPLFLITGRRS